MIFSGLFLLSRSLVVSNESYSDIGMDFVVMAMIETSLWLITIIVIKDVF